MINKTIVAFFLIFLTFAFGKLTIMYIEVYQAHQKAEEQLNKIQQEQERINKMTYVEMVDYIAPQFQQDPHKIKQVIFNESGFKVQCHDSCRARNVTAIHDSTFKTWLPKYEKEMGETLNMDSQFDSIKLMSWAFSKGNSYRNQWTTYVACTNPSGTYSFYSNLMKKSYTVVCQPLPQKYSML